MVSRKLIRFLTCAGFEASVVHEPEQVAENLDGVDLFVSDAFDGDLMVESVTARPNLRGILMTAEPINRTLRYCIEHEQISNVLARKDFESTPAGWELLMIARRLIKPNEAGPSFAHYLNWGFGGFQQKVPTTPGRDKAVEKVQQFISHLGVPKRVADMFGEVTHEMLMNAMYDAPVDAQGTAIYAQDRKAILNLRESEQPTLRLASDGTKLALSVVDPFGRLQRKHVFAGLARGLAGGEMDRSHGGAGLGMVVCHNATIGMFFDVVKGKRTEVTGIFDLDMNQREFRSHAKSLHYFEG